MQKNLRLTGGKLVFDRPLIMGILNITPDSFSGDGVLDPDDAVRHAVEMVEQGADIIDIGGQSTRPGFKMISADEELARLVPVLEKIFNYISVPVSIDTFYPSVAAEAISFGVGIVNDVGGKIDLLMAKTVCNSNCGWVVTATDTAGSSDPTDEVKANIDRLIEEALKAGVSKDQICIDPGFGFGKSEGQCIKLLDNISAFVEYEYPVLIGISRKRMIRALTDKKSVDEYDMISASLGVKAAKKGIDIIRTHNVELTAKELGR